MTTTFWDALIWSAGAILMFMLLWYCAAVRLRRIDLVDIAWGLGFMAVAVLGFLLKGQYEIRHWLTLLLVAVWGGRLSLHLARRIRSRSEDRRYVAMRERWGRSTWWRSLTDVFLLQGVLMLVISLSIIAIMSDSGRPFGWLDIAGLIVWIIGFVFESVGDAQLRSFLRNPANAGKLMTGGLWRYTRHPNYFGEMTQWWGIWLLALGTTSGWLAVISPLTITFLLIKISGVPLLEKQYAGRPDWEAYRKKTSMIVPLPPKQ